MACTANLKRHLLLSIIRAPTLSRPSSSFTPATQARMFRTVSPRQQDDISVTFGPQIDRLLRSGKPARKDVTTNKDKSLQKPSKRKNAKKTSGGSSLDDLNDYSLSNEDENVISKRDGIDKSPYTNRVGSRSSASAQATLELSEDAYNAVSEPEHLTRKTVGLHPTLQRQDPGRKDKRRERSDHQELSSGGHWRLPPEAEASSSRLERKAVSHKKLESWKIQKDALTKKFAGEGWNPRKRLSPDALEGIRGLHQQDPERYTTEMLSQHFKVSPEAIRRILKSNWRPSTEKMEERRQRWAKRHDRIWDHQVELGLRPPRRKDREPEDPEAFEDEVRAKQTLGQL